MLCMSSFSWNYFFLSIIFNERILLSLPPEMGEKAQTFILEIEWLAALKCRATGLSTSLFLTERRCSENLSDSFTDVKFTTFNARNAVNDIEGGACKIVSNNEIGFRSRNGPLYFRYKRLCHLTHFWW